MITKLSRKDIKMLESSAKNNVSKCALEEYLSAHKKAETAWKVFRDSLVLSEGSSEDNASKEMKSEKKRKFKAGDKVRVLSANGALATAGLEIGDVAEVLKYTLRDDIVMLKSPHKSWYAHFFESSLELVEEKSANELRAEIIEKAKEFVDGLRNDKTIAWAEYHRYGVNASFIVNTDKRIVVALLVGENTGLIRAKGIAKCNPSDVFNEHIGKAIALGRALGKDVSEFENAVQPTKVVQGQVITWKLDEEKALYRIDNKTGNQFNFTEIKSNEKHHNYEYREIEKYTNIVDDTNVQYGVGDE